MKLRMYPKSPAPRHIAILKETLMNGGLIIIPTDSVYAIACAADQPDAIKKMAELKGNSTDPSHFSLLFSDLAMVSEYAKPISKDHYKIMNRVLPGPFTFILPSNGNINKIFPGRKTMGVRIPDNNVPLYIIRELGLPLITTSIHDNDALLDYTTDPELIIRNWEGKVDIIVDGGYGNNEPSTVLDCTGEGVTMIRQGIGELDEMIA
jgi:tRNA threonylcarbamoyl adenosine modification protein (Sua5/YciO/YrdC/YwlC family)